MEAAAIPEDPAWAYDVPGGGGALPSCAPPPPTRGSKQGCRARCRQRGPPSRRRADNWVAALWDPAGFNKSSCPWGASVPDTGTRFCQFAGRRAQPMTGANSIPAAIAPGQRALRLAVAGVSALPNARNGVRLLNGRS